MQDWKIYYRVQYSGLSSTTRYSVVVWVVICQKSSLCTATSRPSICFYICRKKKAAFLSSINTTNTKRWWAGSRPQFRGSRACTVRGDRVLSGIPVINVGPWSLEVGTKVRDSSSISSNGWVWGGREEKWGRSVAMIKRCGNGKQNLNLNPEKQARMSLKHEAKFLLSEDCRVINSSCTWYPRSPFRDPRSKSSRQWASRPTASRLAFCIT